MLGFIIALESEYKINPKAFSKKNINGFVVYFDKKNVFIFSGVGKANAAAAASTILGNFKIKKIFNIGSVGSVDKKIKTFDIVIANKFSYFDVDVTHFGYKKNQMAREKEFYLPTAKFSVKNSINATVHTGETFVTKKNYKSFLLSDGVVDMEACAIAVVCAKAKIPFCSVKVVSDSIFESEKSENQWSLNIVAINAIISKTIETIKK